MRTRAVLAGLLLVVAGCGGGTGGGGDSLADPGPGALSGTITVFAASSLTEAFTALADEFMAEHPGVDVRLNFAGSAELAAQVAAGAPVDVLATADGETMQTAITALATDEVLAASVFATNELQIVTEAGNPRGIERLADLADPDLVVVLCDIAVPCGRYAAKAIDAAGVALAPASREQSAKAVMSKVLLGEADAGIVYRTDVAAAGDAVAGVPLAAGERVSVEYQIAARSGALAAAFLDFVLDTDGGSILRSFGFGVG